MSQSNIKKAHFLSLIEKIKGWRQLDFPELLGVINDDEAIANLLSTQKATVTPRTVGSWRLCKRTPNITNSAKLVVLSDGLLTPNKIYSAGIALSIKKQGKNGEFT